MYSSESINDRCDIHWQPIEHDVPSIAPNDYGTGPNPFWNGLSYLKNVISYPCVCQQRQVMIEMTQIIIVSVVEGEISQPPNISKKLLTAIYVVQLNNR